MHLLKLSIAAQCGPGDADMDSAAQEALQSKRLSLRRALAACFASVWFPPVRVQGAAEPEATEDYSALLQKAAGTAANHARFLEVFLL